MTASLRQRLRASPILLAPGVYDALSALIAGQAGAEAVYLSGASIAYTRFGRPDIGLVGMSEVADTIAVLRDRIALPIIVDADNGFGNVLNVQRTVRVFERSGHTPQYEEATLVDAELVGWLKTRPQPPARRRGRCWYNSGVLGTPAASQSSAGGSRGSTS